MSTPFFVPGSPIHGCAVLSDAMVISYSEDETGKPRTSDEKDGREHEIQRPDYAHYSLDEVYLRID